MLAEKTGISVTSVQNHVNKLKSIGILKRIGSAKSVVFLIAMLPMPSVVKGVVKDVVKELTERQRRILEIIKLASYISAISTSIPIDNEKS